jgi:hypothetical protein
LQFDGIDRLPQVDHEALAGEADFAAEHSIT